MNSPLHVHFINKNQRAFRSLLDQSRQHASVNPSSTSLSSSGPRSWQNSSWLSSYSSATTTSSTAVDVNARDHLGRTVLHLAAASVNPSTPDFVRMLLAHPSINLNLQDYESHWTALHRALWVGNLPVAILLLQCADLDISIKDYDGYTAFDVYNSTVEGTNPQSSASDSEAKDLLIWGSNRNAALGLGDAGDRSHPEPVNLSKNDDDQRPGSTRFLPIHVKEISMARLHTVVVTAETSANVRACGFGSGGRLAPGQHTQYSFTQLQHLSHLSITSVALAQDHSLVLSDAGDVYSWGLNRFHQLGYVIEGKEGQGLAEQIQATARKVYGALKKEVVVGIAACKIASACWTATNVYTWGTNRGQLGYPKASVPVQILPRKIAQFTQPVLSVALSSTALCGLLATTHDVLCLYNDTSFKVIFPLNAFPSSINHPYRPPAASPRTSIAKITCCEDISGTTFGTSSGPGVTGSDALFAALGTHGDVFTWTMGEPVPGSERDHGASDRSGGTAIKPQRVWALRRQMSAVKDVAISSDGTILLCTQSGHVFIRSRSGKSSTATISGSSTSTSSTKFHRVAYLNRVVEVCASPAGAFAALRVDAKPPGVDITKSGRAFSLDLSRLMTWLPDTNGDSTIEGPKQEMEVEEQEQEWDETEEEVAVRRDVITVERMFKALGTLKAKDGQGEEILSRTINNASTKGADILISVGDLSVSAHSSILCLRSEPLGRIIRDNDASPLKDKTLIIVCTRCTSDQAPEGRGFLIRPSQEIKFKGVHSLTVLLLLQYLYTDDVAAVWDRRVAVLLGAMGRNIGAGVVVKPLDIKAELQALARMLKLAELNDALNAASKRLPIPTLGEDLSKGFSAHFDSLTAIPQPSLYHTSFDVILQLSDCRVACHSAILRSRSPFFESFFDDDDWTRKRWELANDEEADVDVLVVNLEHLEWKSMEHVVKFLCGGSEDERLFDAVDFVKTVDEKVDHLFLVMAAANELLLDKLILICSNIVLQHVTIMNVGSLLAEATFLHAHELVQALQHYIAMNLESLLERGLLDDLSPELLKNLTEFLRKQQTLKLPLTRSGSLMETAMAKWADWLALQDIPQQYTIRSSAKQTSAGNRELKTASSKPTLNQIPVPADGGIQPKSIVTDTGASSLPSPAPGILNASGSKPMSRSVQREASAPAILEQCVSPSVSPPVHSSTPWKRSGVPASSEKIDMRAIMASEAEGSRSFSTAAPPKARVTGFQVPGPSAPQPPGSPKFIAKLPQRDRRKSNQGAGGDLTNKEQGASTTPPRASLLAGGSPWKTVTKSSLQQSLLSEESQGQTSTSPSQVRQHTQEPSASNDRTTPPSGIARSLSETAVVSQGSSTPRTPTKVQPPSMGKPSPTALGPVITPVRASPSTSDMGRRGSSGHDAWSGSSQSTFTPSGLPMEGLSFVAIQEQQRELGLAGSRKTPKRSLLEIQEEEQAKQVEAEFLSWWTMEEQRVRAELEAAMREPQPPSNPRKKSDKPAASGRGRKPRNTQPSSSGPALPNPPDTFVGPIPIPTPGPSTPNHSGDSRRPKPRKSRTGNTGS